MIFQLSTDIDLAGNLNPQSLRADFSRVEIHGGASSPRIFAWDFVTAVRARPGIGGGLLQFCVDERWVDVLRYRNRSRFEFDQAVVALEEMRAGKNLTAEVRPHPDPQRCPTCHLMMKSAVEVCPRCVAHGASLRRAFAMIKPHQKSALILFCLLVLGLALDMAWPLLTRFLVDHVLVTTSDVGPLIWGFSPRRALLAVVGCVAVIQVARAVVNSASSFLSNRVGNRMTFAVRNELMGKLQKLSLDYYAKQETGSLVGRVVYDTEAVQGFMAQITSGFLLQFGLVLASFTMMFWLEPCLSLWALAPAPLVLLGAILYWRNVHPRYQRLWDRTSKQAGLVNGVLTGIRVVKTFAKEDFEFGRFQNSSRAVRDTKDQLDQTAAYFYPMMGVVFQVGGWLIWFVGGGRVLGQTMSLGTLMAFFGYLGMFYGPLGNLTNLTSWLTQFSTQMHRITEILDAPDAARPKTYGETIARARGHLELRDVDFSYTRGQPVLNKINIEVAPGESVGLVGRSGCGKTSILNLVFRLNPIDGGELFLDGMAAAKISPDEWRRHFSLVPQTPFLFNGTFSENINYGGAWLDPVKVMEVAKMANAHEFILHHQLGYETGVGEGGQELSGGERQRISIARALLRPAAILVLDEATSALDSESERSIQIALESLRPRRSTLIVAHRLSTLRHCDRIYVIDQGRVAESGRPRELLVQDGLFAHFARLQQNEFAEPPPTPPGSAAMPITWLDPARTIFFAGPHDELCVEIASGEIIRGVFALRAFPVSQPGELISLRAQGPSGADTEIGFIRRLADWAPAARALIEAALNKRYLMQEIDRVLEIERLGPLLSFRVRTKLGEANFVVRGNLDGIKPLGTGGRLLVDLEDDVYVIKETLNLPSVDRKLLDRFVYW